MYEMLCYASFNFGFALLILPFCTFASCPLAGSVGGFGSLSKNENENENENRVSLYYDSKGAYICSRSLRKPWSFRRK